MQKLDFLKFSPGGNPTILITGPAVPAAERMKTSLRLLHPLHLQAEQVGFAALDAAPPRLDMMGGEFCLNASRCLAFAAARENRFLPLDGTDDLFGLLSVSGQPETLQARIQGGKKALRQAEAQAATLTEMECFVSLRCGTNAEDLREIGPGAWLARLPGISHLLLDEGTHARPANPLEEAAAWRRKLGLENEPASGVVWCKEYPANDFGGGEALVYRITPVVYVAETKTSVLESACGSASLALSLLAAATRRNCALLRLEIFQPSNESLSITLSGQGESRLAEVGGSVRLCAAGEAYL